MASIPKYTDVQRLQTWCLGLHAFHYLPCLLDGIRVGVIHPWFVYTALAPTNFKVGLVGVPITPVERVAGAIVYAATDPDMETRGCPWLLPDDGYVSILEKERLKEGVYKMIGPKLH